MPWPLQICRRKEASANRQQQPRARAEHALDAASDRWRECPGTESDSSNLSPIVSAAAAHGRHSP